MIRHPLASIALALSCLIGLYACGGGGGGSSPPPPPPVAAPTITTQPKSVTVNAGAAASFTVVASGATSYQWQRNGSTVSGATSATYTLSPADSSNNGDSYTVTASNSSGSVTSSAALLRVTGVSVLAGQIGGEGYVDGTKAQARLWGPAALAIDAGGNLLVADYNAIRKITPTGDVSTVIGSARVCDEIPGIGVNARLCFPYALAIDFSGKLYVADTGTTIWRIDTNAQMTAFETVGGCISSLAVSSPLLYVGIACGGLVGTIETTSTTVPGPLTGFASLGGPIGGMSFDSSLNMYVAGGTTVEKISSTAVVSTLAGTSGMTGSSDGQGAAARFGCANYPVGSNYYASNGAVSIATLASGMSYVADYCNDTIRAVTPSGAVTTFGGSAGIAGADDGQGTAARFFGPTAVVADPNGNIFVADYLNGLIRKITPAGTVSTYAGQTPHAGHADGTAAESTFRYPYGIVADSAGNLYVTDTYNFTIRKITPAGVVSTLAGTPGASGFANGTGSAARFALPQGIAIDANGDLYVADNLNQVVRKVTQAGVVTTFAGTPGAIGSPFNEPEGVAVDKAGNVYVTDLTGIFEVDASGAVKPQLASLPNARAITVAPNGAIYLTAGSTNGVTGAVYSLAGTALMSIATTSFSSRMPGIVVAGDGKLYVTDVSNSRIDVVGLDGTVEAVAGVGGAPPIGTVPGGLPASINSPSGLALLSTGTSVSFAVVDSFEHAVLRVDLP